MKTRAGIGVTPATILSWAALCVLMCFCSGCLRHRISIVDGYQVNDNNGAPMLVPTAAASATSGEFQSATITLPSDANRPVPEDCAIKGSIFSLHPASASDATNWIVRSPSPSEWNTLSAEEDVDAEWQQFVRGLVRMQGHGCFPPGLTSQFIRSAIAERIPLPASDVPRFIYSDQGERFVNLAPGIEIGIEKVLSKGAPVSVQPGSRISLPMLTVDYDVVARPGEGIRLKLTSGPDHKMRSLLGTEDRQLLTLDRQFAQTPVMRLLLQGITGGNSKSDAFLIGAPDATQLDALTDLIRQKDPVACIDRPGTVCMGLPSGAVSLYSSIWVNGRRTASSFGSPLLFLLLPLPPAKRDRALETLQISRRLGPNRYVGIQFTRTLDGARQVLLLPEDRIEWRE